MTISCSLVYSYPGLFSIFSDVGIYIADDLHYACSLYSYCVKFNKFSHEIKTPVYSLKLLLFTISEKKSS